MILNRNNKFSVLQDEEYIFKFPKKLSQLEIHPLAILIKYRNITHLDPHPTSYLIKFLCIFDHARYKYKVKFNDKFHWYFKEKFQTPAWMIRKRNNDSYHDDILLKSELDRLENKMKDAELKLENTKNIRYKYITKLEEEISEIKNDCKYYCLKWLDQIHICNCTNCYNCRNNDGIDKFDTGRCRHHYQIEEKLEDISWNETCISEYHSHYYNIKNHFEREKAKKQNYLDEYEMEMEEEYENLSFQEGMYWSLYNREYKKPVYIY